MNNLQSNNDGKPISNKLKKFWWIF